MTDVQPTEVHIRVESDEDANRVSAVLEALGYRVLRDLDAAPDQARMDWAADRLATRHKLTARERDVVELVLAGLDNEDIGLRLEISRATVKWHMHNVFCKTLTGNRESLLRLALQLGGVRGPTVHPDPDDRPDRPASEPLPVAAVPSKSWF